MNLNDLATFSVIKTFQLVIIFASLGHNPMVLNRGSVEPQGFDEVISGVRRTFSDILTYCE